MPATGSTKHTNIVTLVFQCLALAAALGAEVTTAEDYGNWVPVTCRLVYYAQIKFPDGDIQLTVADPPHTNDLGMRVEGVVMEVLTPEELARKTICISLDFAPVPVADVYYLPGVVYKGRYSRRYIGTLFFKGPVPFEPTKLTGPLPRVTPRELRQLLYDRRWLPPFVRAIKDEFGDDVLFRVLYGVFTETNRSTTQYKDQSQAGAFLRQYRPSCPISARTVVRETLTNWEENVGDWPLFLQHCFGRKPLLDALVELEKGKVTEVERDKIESWRYWLSGDDKDVNSSSRK